MVSTSRYWTFTYIPDSVLDFSHLMKELLCHFDFVVSPLHHSQMSSCGDFIKAHYHFLLVFPREKTFEQVKYITDFLNVSIPQRCDSDSVRAMIRYFCHLDHEGREQYNINDVNFFGNTSNLAKFLFDN